jgi:hypothetical protein
VDAAFETLAPQRGSGAASDANAARRSDNESLNWHSDERAWFLAHRERFAHGLR